MPTEVTVHEMSLCYLLGVRPWSLGNRKAFQKAMQAKFITRTTEVRPRNPRTPNAEKYEEFRKAFYILFIRKLREAYNTGRLDAVESVKGLSTGAFAYMPTGENCLATHRYAEEMNSHPLGSNQNPESEESNSLNDSEANILQQNRSEISSHLIPLVDRIGVNSIIDLMGNKF